MKKTKAMTATFVLVLLWLLSGISSFCNAENIPISEQGIQDIGPDKVRLESGIGVVVFNLSKGSYTADGYLTVSNTFNSSVTITCYKIKELSTVDLDENGQPRIHPVISNNIIFEQIPDISWVTLEDSKASIDPYSVYNFRYTVNIPEGKKFTTDKGYLTYINIKKDVTGESGAQIGIDYNYKLFIVFTGEPKEQGLVFSQWMLYILIPAIIIGGSLIVFSRRKHKKKDIVSTKKPVNNNSVTADNISSVDKHINYRDTDIVNLDNKIDNLLERKNTILERENTHKFRGNGG